MTKKIPLSLHEGLIAKHLKRTRSGEVEKDDAILALFDAAAFARQVGEQIASLHSNVMADESKTPAARLIESRKGVQQLAEKAAAKLDAARAKADAALKAITRETSAPVAAMNDAEIALDGEIRHALAAMSEKDRGEKIAEAIKGGDDQIVRAALSGPAWLVGLGNAQREHYRHSWRTARFPTEVEREARLRKAVGAGDVVGTCLIDFVKGLAETPAAELAQASAERAAAAQAAATAAAE